MKLSSMILKKYVMGKENTMYQVPTYIIEAGNTEIEGKLVLVVQKLIDFLDWGRKGFDR